MPVRQRLPLLAGGLLLAYCFVRFGIGFLVDFPLPFLGWAPLPVVSLLAAYDCWTTSRRVRLDPATRRFWRHLALCCAVLALACAGNAYDVVRAPDSVQHISPGTTALYLAILAFAVWALLRLPAWQRTRAEWTRFWLDTGIILITTGMLIWHFSLARADAWARQTGSALPALLIAMVASVSVIAFTKVAFAGTGKLDRRAMHLLSFGTGMAAVAGAMMPFLASRPQLNTAFVAVPVATFCAQLAARRQGRRGATEADARPVARSFSVVPYVAIAGMDVLLLATNLTAATEGRLIAAGTVAITALVVLRQITTLRENTRLLSTVDANLRQLRDYQAQLAHQVRHDTLTEIANRASFEEQVTGRLAAGGTFLVALLDLDDFKVVNDRLGHGTGDALLKAVSRRLHDRLRAEDVVARLGGDEFTLLLPGLTGDEAAAVLGRVIAGVQEPILIDAHEMVPRISIGVTASLPGDTPGELLRRADVAMYAAKNAGGGRWAWFDPAMDQLADQDARLGADLRQAIARDQLRVVYQPIVELPDGRIAGVEALLRWRHPEHGDVSPAVFIPLAERNGAIIEIGRWVFEQVVTQAAEWQRAYGTAAPGRVSVNVSARQLREPGFVAEVAAAVAAAGVDPALIVAEVTETAVLGTGAALDAVRGLNELGLRVALDDFGTGHSSLSLLVDCPVDVLKVDKSFVDGVTTTSPQAVIVDNLIGITAGLRIQAVAEGVETADQARRLHQAGYRYAQGFYFARPMSGADVGKLLAPGAVPA
ncbi:bifunctional diguanylate cyclase/phosphodiesterase [Actinoplanes sp. N902-109]|uniref:putative bifunctional diguanylate cyclase/phosphodiesterase n=1 Tax=Actinoplanes sp. (strain N902-109) TaxID=649831 RepID=UPI00032958F0|nr:EAL domain-containing protein [Actinoplanes sp. N902-109]AGL19365.1 PAS/PAC and GAF sensor-containing diguanylate cyclase/phosphodiesterase [Actinoplanes sp. N902-109]